MAAPSYNAPTDLNERVQRALKLRCAEVPEGALVERGEVQRSTSGAAKDGTNGGRACVNGDQTRTHLGHEDLTHAAERVRPRRGTSADLVLAKTVKRRIDAVCGETTMVTPCRRLYLC